MTHQVLIGAFLFFSMFHTADHVHSAYVDGSIDRDAEVWLPGCSKWYPVPSEFDDVEPSQDFALYGRAPWFELDALEGCTVLRHYVDGGMLPGGIPFIVTKSCF